MKPYSILFTLLLIVSLILAGIGDSARFITKEGGIVEDATIYLYAAVILSVLWIRPMKLSSGNFLAAALVLALILRELDFDKAFTTMGIFKSRFYSTPEIPLMEKILAACATLLLAGVFFLLVKQYARSVLAGVKKSQYVEWGILTAFLLAAFSKLVLDGLPRKLSKIGIETAAIIDQDHGTIEEVFELGIPIALLIALFYKMREAGRAKKIAATDSSDSAHNAN